MKIGKVLEIRRNGREKEGNSGKFGRKSGENLKKCWKLRRYLTEKKVIGENLGESQGKWDDQGKYFGESERNLEELRKSLRKSKIK